METLPQDPFADKFKGGTKVGFEGRIGSQVSNPENQERLPSLALRITTVTVSLLISLSIAEVGLRLMGVKPARVPYGDAALGFIPLKNSISTDNLPDNGPAYVFRVNNLTFLEDQDTPLAKPAGVQRIVVVGDSQTACGCANANSYPHLLQAKLNQISGAKFEVLNAGVGRYSPYQYYVRAKKYVVPLKPDRLIVGFYIGNDFLDLIRQDDRPYITWNSDGSFTEHPPVFLVFTDPAERGEWLDNSRVYSLLKVGIGHKLYYDLTRARMLMHDARSAGYGPVDTFRYMMAIWQLSRVGVNFLTQITNQQVWFEHFPETMQTARAVNLHVMQMFADLCRENNIRLTYILLPTKIDIEPDDLKEALAQVRQIDPNLTADNIRKFDDAVSEEVLREGRELNVEVVDLRPYLRSQKHSRRLYYKEDMHLTADGNSVVAKVLASVLLDETRQTLW